MDQLGEPLVEISEDPIYPATHAKSLKHSTAQHSTSFGSHHKVQIGQQITQVRINQMTVHPIGRVTQHKLTEEQRTLVWVAGGKLYWMPAAYIAGLI